VRVWGSVVASILGLWLVIRSPSSWALIVAMLLAVPIGLVIGSAVMRRRKDLFAAPLVAILLGSLPAGFVLFVWFTGQLYS
jgi:hypothetical protein